MRAELLIAVLTLTLAACGSVSAGVKGRDRVANNRRHRRRYNPYAVPPMFESPYGEKYDDMEVSSYCRESVAHHENYVRERTHATNSSSKVRLSIKERSQVK